MTGPPRLSIQGLHKSFGDLEVLRGIDLEVAEHEVIALIGASGSGKSTLLRCINLIEPIDAGRILIEGEEITARGVKVDRIRRRIGIVFQAFNLFPHMTVLDNVTLAPRKVLRRPRRRCGGTTRLALLERFGLAEKAHEFPDRLSGGQQQRVAIVRALAMQPDLLLLDEVTSALDPELVAEVLNVIRELAAGGMTMLIATHEMGFARDIASRVCFLDAGRILEQGPPAQIFEEPREAADAPVPQPDHRGGAAAGLSAPGSGAPLSGRAADPGTRPRRTRTVARRPWAWIPCVPGGTARPSGTGPRGPRTPSTRSPAGLGDQPPARIGVRGPPPGPPGGGSCSRSGRSRPRRTERGSARGSSRGPAAAGG